MYSVRFKRDNKMIVKNKNTEGTKGDGRILSWGYVCFPIAVQIVFLLRLEASESC